MNYITPRNKPKPKYKIHRYCTVCGRPIVIHLDKDRVILSKHAFFALDESKGEYWECKECLRDVDEKWWEDFREERTKINRMKRFDGLIHRL